MNQKYIIPGHYVQLDEADTKLTLVGSRRHGRILWPIPHPEYCEVKQWELMDDNDKCQRTIRGEPCATMTPFVQYLTRAEWDAWIAEGKTDKPDPSTADTQELPSHLLGVKMKKTCEAEKIEDPNPPWWMWLVVGWWAVTYYCNPLRWLRGGLLKLVRKWDKHTHS